MSNIIILSGSSCSGKSTLQKEIQRIMSKPFIKLGIDQLFDAVVPDFMNLESAPENFEQNTIRSVVFETKDDKPSIKLIVGVEGQKVIDGMIERN